MAKFPEPPGVDHLKQLPPAIHALPADTVVTRIYFAGGEHPTRWNTFRTFGPTASRFDHHQLDANGQPYEQERGIMYLSAGPEAIPTALAEVFQAARTIDRHAGSPVLVGFRLTKTVELLDLRGTFATKLGASTAIHSGPRPRARRWSQQLYRAYPDLAGIYYCSSMYGNEPAIALFERAKPALPGKILFHRELRDPALAAILTQTAGKIRYVLV